MIHRSAISHQTGVALFQVLLIVAILSVISIQFSKSSRQQVSVAQDFNDRLDAELILRTTQSNVLQQFFTKDSEDLSDKMVKGKRWNLRGARFNYAPDVDVTLEAIVGKLSLVTAPDDLLLKAFRGAGAEPSQASSILASVKDWIDSNDSRTVFGADGADYADIGLQSARNGPLQHISELAVIKGMDPKWLDELDKFVTIYPAPSFNPFLASRELNSALFGDSVAQKIVEAVAEGRVDERAWYSIVGSSSSDFIDLHPRSIFRITIHVQKGDVRLEQSLDLVVQVQKARQPFVILRRS